MFSGCSKLTSRMRASQCHEPKISSASPGNLRVLWNQKVHYHFDTCTPPSHMTSYSNPKSTHPQPVFNIGFNIVLPSTPFLSSGLLPSVSPPNPVRTSPHACCMYYPPNSPLFHHSNYSERNTDQERPRSEFHKHTIRTQRTLSVALQFKQSQLISSASSPSHTVITSPSYLLCSTFK
jgi:hypothetical protein